MENQNKQIFYKFLQISVLLIFCTKVKIKAIVFVLFDSVLWGCKGRNKCYQLSNYINFSLAITDQQIWRYKLIKFSSQKVFLSINCINIKSTICIFCFLFSLEINYFNCYTAFYLTGTKVLQKFRVKVDRILRAE